MSWLSMNVTSSVAKRYCGSSLRTSVTRWKPAASRDPSAPRIAMHTAKSSTVHEDVGPMGDRPVLHRPVMMIPVVLVVVEVCNELPSWKRASRCARRHGSSCARRSWKRSHRNGEKSPRHRAGVAHASRQTPCPLFATECSAKRICRSPERPACCRMPCYRASYAGRTDPKMTSRASRATGFTR